MQAPTHLPPGLKPKHRRLRAAAIFASDLVMLLLAWVTAVFISSLFGRFSWQDVVPVTTLAGTVFTLMTLLILLATAWTGQYVRRMAFWEETRQQWRYAASAALFNFAINFLLQVAFNRTVLVLAWLLVFVYLPVGRVLVREALISLGLWQRRALLVGNPESSGPVFKAMTQERHAGFDVVALALPLSESRTDTTTSLPYQVYSDVEHVDLLARQLGCEVIVLLLDERQQSRMASIAADMHEHALEVFVVPALQGLPVHGMQAQHFFSNDVLFLRLQHKLLSPTSRWLKRIFDIVASLGLLVLLSPLMAFVAWRIWREDGGPVLYTQPRVGKGGLDFSFIKFRSMVRDADARLSSWRDANPELYRRYEEGNFKLPDDPRVLRVGRWIRRTSVDELPQLWNVLRGDMSLVGPRPLLRRELGQYPHQAMALYEQVLPGITGLWQVGGRSQTTFEQRAAYDGWYVRNWSLWVDWVILLKTVRVVLSGRGAM